MSIHTLYKIYINTYTWQRHWRIIYLTGIVTFLLLPTVSVYTLKVSFHLKKLNYQIKYLCTYIHKYIGIYNHMRTHYLTANNKPNSKLSLGSSKKDSSFHTRIFIAWNRKSTRTIAEINSILSFKFFKDVLRSPNRIFFIKKQNKYNKL